MVSVDYRCPFCDSHISKEKYDLVVRENKLLKEENKQLKIENADLKKINKEHIKSHEKSEKDLELAKLKIKEDAEKQKLKLENEVLKVKEKEKKKYGDAVKSLELKIKNLEEGKTASEKGFDYEKELFGILEAELPNDKVSLTGKMGDIMVEVQDKKETIGTMLLELKKVGRHTKGHVEQVKRHTIDASADVGILVTNGDFGSVVMDGFKNMDGVLIIRPHSAVDFVKLIRKNLLAINKLKVSFKEKENELAKLWEFINSIEFETQMNSIFRDINQFRELDAKETKILAERDKIEDHMLSAYNLIKEGIGKIKKN